MKEYNAFYPQPSISVLEVLAQSCYILYVLFSEEDSEDAVAKLQKQDTLKISFETVLQEGDQKRWDAAHIKTFSNVKTWKEHN